jgi:hypothetical protein
MVLSPIMQVAATLAEKLAPQIISGASDFISSNYSSAKSRHHFCCPSCNRVGRFGDTSSYTHLICDCGYEFPCRSGGTRCTCGTLLFPASQSQELVYCDRCCTSWKTKSNKKVFGKCRCHNNFEVSPQDKLDVTSCCNTPLGQLSHISYKTQEPRVPSEAERNR